MEVVFSKPIKLGNRSYKAGKQEVPDNLAHNLAFKEGVRSGAIQVAPRNVARQKIQSSHDTKAQQRARHALMARQSHPSAPGALIANPTHSGAPEPVQALPTPAQPIQTGAAAQASAPAAPVTAKVEN